MEKNRLLYKGKPLVRCGDEIFYGEPGAKYVVNIKILSNKLVAGAEIADRVHVTLVDNCASSPRERATIPVNPSPRPPLRPTPAPLPSRVLPAHGRSR